MNWARLRPLPWLDTRAAFVAATPSGGQLLDLGSSDGETLGHFAELRPDLKFFAADLQGAPEKYPAGCQFHRGDLQCERLPWPDASMDAITCMHLVEHLEKLDNLFGEARRLLKPGGRLYVETPHPRTVNFPSPRGSVAVGFTMNFYDDATHVRPVSAGRLAHFARGAGLEVTGAGISRNWLFAVAYLVYWALPPSRKKYTAQIHFRGWSAFLTARRPT